MELTTDWLRWLEWVLDLAALLTALLGGCTVLQRRSDGAGRLMGWAALILAIGEAVHLLPQVVQDQLGRPAFWLLLGRMAAELALTVFCILLSLLWEKLYERKNSYYAEMAVRDLSGIRALGCVAPVVIVLSGILSRDDYDPLAELTGPLALVPPAVRCVPLLIAALIVALHWRKTRDELPTLRPVWLLLILAALFAVAADLGAAVVPLPEKLYLLKLLCLDWIVVRFVRYAGESGELH